jgi:hypothetical protein
VDDDGTIYNISEDELNKSIDNLKMMVKSINCEIESIINENNYVKIKIVKLELNLNFKEIRVLLVGDTYTVKTTFLAFLIKNLLCKNANLFLLNHKHEIESGKSSSIAVHYYYYNNNNNNYRFVFFDTPGDKKYNKTKRKLMDKNRFIFSTINNKQNSQLLINKEEYYQTDGVFCSFNCCKSFIKDNKHNRLYEQSEFLLIKMYNDVLSSKNMNINEAPHWRLLEEYGGNLTINQFRENFNKVSYEYHGIIKNENLYRSIALLFEEKINF